MFVMLAVAIRSQIHWNRASCIRKWKVDTVNNYSLNYINSLSATAYLPKTASRPARTSSSLARGNLPTCSVRSCLSIETTSEAFATESSRRFVWCAARSMFPGTFAHLVLVVRGTHTTVAIRLRLNASLCMMITGRLKPGPEPIGTGRSAHHTSPCEITTRCSPTRGAKQLPRIHQFDLGFHRRRG
jgi:hypothetical protein